MSTTPKLQPAASTEVGMLSSKSTDVVETASAAVAARARAAVEARFVMAERHPRDFAEVRQRLLADCSRPSFAEAAIWTIKRGGKPISGLSIRFAEAAIRAMRNIATETTVVYDDEARRVVRVEVTDLEANSTFSQDVAMEKAVERRSLGQGQVALSSRVNSYGDLVHLVRATEDDMAMRANALISKAVRTLAMRLLPGDLIDEAQRVMASASQRELSENPGEVRKRMVDGFAGFGVTVAQIKRFMGGTSIDELDTAQVTLLRGIYTAMREGASWTEATAAPDDDAQAREKPPDGTARSKVTIEPADTADASQPVDSDPLFPWIDTPTKMKFARSIAIKVFGKSLDALDGEERRQLVARLQP